MTVCIIPARGGSKRISRKNIRLFRGKPLLGRVIETVTNAGCFDHIIVSTDDQEIAEVATQFGATTPFTRPAELADDFATTKQVMVHAFDQLQSMGTCLREVCCIYPTATFLRADDLLEGLRLFREDRWQCVMAATPFSAPVQRSFKRNQDGGMTMLFDKEFSSRSQDLEPYYYDAGQFYWAHFTTWMKEESILNCQIAGIKLPRLRAIDIDNWDDRILAEHIYKGLNSGIWMN